MTHGGESPVEKLIQESTGFDENGMYRKEVLDVSLACKMCISIVQANLLCGCMFSTVHETNRFAVGKRPKMC